MNPPLSLQAVNRPENAVGWYHSHPGYGCWLSGIDVNTQMMNQQYQAGLPAMQRGRSRVAHLSAAAAGRKRSPVPRTCTTRRPKGLS